MTPSPCSTNSTSGNAASPCETRYAGPLQRVLEDGRVDDAFADHRAFVAARGVGVEDRFQARFLDRGQARGQRLRASSGRLCGCSPGRAPAIRRLTVEGRAVGFAALAADGRRQLRRERQARAVGDLERRGDAGAARLCSRSASPVTAMRFAVGRVELEFRARSTVDFELFDLRRHAFDRFGEPFHAVPFSYRRGFGRENCDAAFGVDRRSGRVRVDGDARAHDDPAEVERPGV